LRKAGDAGRKASQGVSRWGRTVPDRVEEGFKTAARRVNAGNLAKGAGRLVSGLAAVAEGYSGYQSQQDADDKNGVTQERGQRGVLEGGGALIGGAVGAAACAPGLVLAAGCGVVGGALGDAAADAILGGDDDGILTR
jgi:hypothetical protein